jgi:hypothetical protein
VKYPKNTDVCDQARKVRGFVDSEENRRLLPIAPHGRTSYLHAVTQVTPNHTVSDLNHRAESTHVVSIARLCAMSTSEMDSANPRLRASAYEVLVLT